MKLRLLVLATAIVYASNATYTMFTKRTVTPEEKQRIIAATKEIDRLRQAGQPIPETLIRQLPKEARPVMEEYNRNLGKTSL